KHCEVIKIEKFKTAPDGLSHFRANLIRTITDLRDYAQLKDYKLLGVGVGLAGAMDAKTGKIRATPNLLCLEGFPLQQQLEKVLKTKVYIGNDVQVGL